jgi:hypothetical protein
MTVMLSVLSGRLNLHHEDLDGDQDVCNLRLAKRTIRNIIFWLLAIAYAVFSCFTICAFIAYAADAFVNDWALSALISLIQNAVLSPLTLAIILSSAASVILAFLPDVSRRAQLEASNVRTFVSTFRASTCSAATAQLSKCGTSVQVMTVSFDEFDGDRASIPKEARLQALSLTGISGPCDRCDAADDDLFVDVLPVPGTVHYR